MLLLLATLARAADLDTFVPAATAWCGSGVQVADPGAAAGEVCLGILGTYARDPVVQRWGDDVEAVLADAVGARFGVAAGVGRGVMVAVDVPYYPYLGGVAGADAAVGDIHLAGAAALPRGAARLLIAPRLTLPTGREEAWVGAAGVGGGLTLGGAVDAGPVTAQAGVGLAAVPPEQVEGVPIGPAAEAQLGVRWRPGARAAVGAELDGAAPLGEAFTAASSPVELHVYGQWAGESGVVASLGAGTGLVAGLGAPEVRVFLGLGWRGVAASDGTGG